MHRRVEEGGGKGSAGYVVLHGECVMLWVDAMWFLQSMAGIV